MRGVLAGAAALIVCANAWAGERPVGPATPATRTGPLAVTGIKAVYRNGQAFVTWKDVAEGDEAAKYRYSLYRSERPITQENLASAELCYKGVLYNSCKLFGSAFNKKDRLDPSKPTATIEEGGQSLPMWSGLAVHTVTAAAKAYYAVVATDEKYAENLTKVVPGESATTAPVEETVAPIQPILLMDSKSRPQRAPETFITGQKNLPLQVSFHASSGQGGGASAWGDYYLYFATQDMGWRDGLPGVFSVEERRREKAGNYLVLNSRDAIVTPNATPMETYWFGYYCVPQWAKDKEPRAYPFTENRMLWVIDWTMKKYAADPERVYGGGQSMGGWASSTFAFRRTEIFAAVTPTLPRMRQRGLPSLVPLKNVNDALMPDGQTRYVDRMDSVKFATDHHEDLPFFAWSIGRHDGFATWKEQVDMVKAMTAAHHGFAMAWNDGGHSEGAQPKRKVDTYFGTGRFALHQSYPAFGNSSLNEDMGTGELDDKRQLKDGAKEGGINLGFIWKDVVDEADKWSVSLTNDRAKDDMTVDVTPRRCQAFKPKAGDALKWTSSTGDAGQVTADQWGLVTIAKVKIKAGAATTLTITR